MSKPVKGMLTEELRQRYTGTDSACVVDLAGLSVKAQETIRAALRAKSARVEVVKNSVARRSMLDTPLEPLGKSLEGPCALVTTDDSIIEAAKVLVELKKDAPGLTLKQAMVDGDPELFSVDAVSKMKSRMDLLGELAMLVASPGRAIAGCLTSPASKVAGCLKAIVDKAA